MEKLTKICIKCNCEKELTEFGNLKSSKDGKHSYCKVCSRLVNKKSRLNNKEKIKIRKQQDYQNNKEKILQQRKEYYNDNRKMIIERVAEYTKVNKEQILNRQRTFRKENVEHIKNQDRQKYVKFREQILENRKRYFKENKEQIRKAHNAWYKTENGRIFTRNKNMKRRAKYREGDVTNQQLKDLLKSSNECYWCNDKLIKGHIHVDHFFPLSNGGKHTISNLVVACASCNLSKGAKQPLDFAKEINVMPHDMEFIL